jgi:Family of unknown function (DUF6062)
MALEEYIKIDVSDELLTHALGQRICPICLILQNKTNELLCKLQFEAVHKQGVNALVLSAGGYCHFHFWYLEKLVSPVTNAQFLQDLLKKIEKECIEDSSGDAADSFSDESHCPVCSSCREWEQKLLISFTRKMPENDFCARYESLRGLCLPHLSKVLKKLPDKEQRTFLAKSSHHQMDVLLQELSLLVTKWQNKDRSPGRESDSAYRAIGKLVGGKYYRAG